VNLESNLTPIINYNLKENKRCIWASHLLRVNLKIDPMVPDQLEGIIEKPAHHRIFSLIHKKKRKGKEK
jgi:hypothetical protein